MTPSDNPNGAHLSFDIDDKIDHGIEFQMEFKRFLNKSLGTIRCDKYLKGFIVTNSNDIRFVDPDIFDDHLLENDEMGMKENYIMEFINRGIVSLWSFYFHAQMIWNKLGNWKQGNLINIKLTKNNHKKPKKLSIKSNNK